MPQSLYRFDYRQRQYRDLSTGFLQIWDQSEIYLDYKVPGNDSGDRAYQEETLAEMIEMAEVYEVNCLIGSSGSFDTLAEMISCKNGDCNLWKKKKNYTFLMADYNQIQRVISEATLAERLKMEGLKDLGRYR